MGAVAGWLVWSLRLHRSPANVVAGDLGPDAGDRQAGTRSPCREHGCCRATARRSTSTCACRSPARRRSCRRTTRPACTGASSPCRFACGAPPPAAGRFGELDGLRLGQRRVRRFRHGQPPAVYVRHHAPATGANAVCIVVPRGAPRRGSRTRTSGGCPGCTAASSWCRCRGVVSATRRRCRGSSRRHDGHARARRRASSRARHDSSAERPSKWSSHDPRPPAQPAGDDGRPGGAEVATRSVDGGDRRRRARPQVRLARPPRHRPSPRAGNRGVEPRDARGATASS